MDSQGGHTQPLHRGAYTARPTSFRPSSHHNTPHHTTGLVSSVEKLSHRAILKLTEDVVYLICAGEANTSGGPQVWAQVKVPTVFKSFRIESNTENQIFLEFVPTALSKALKSGGGAPNIAVRLAKRASTDHPVLSFSIEGVSRSGHSLDIVQEVAVRVLKLAEVQEMAKEPMCPEPDVHIVLPNPSDTLRTVVDRMKNSHSVIHFAANLEGKLKLRVESDLVNIETQWKNLKNPDIGGCLSYGRGYRTVWSPG